MAPANWQPCANLPLASCQAGTCHCISGAIHSGPDCICNEGLTLKPYGDGCVKGRMEKILFMQPYQLSPYCMLQANSLSRTAL